MFFYFPIKHKNGTVVGRVCVQNGRASFSLSRPIDADATLFADGRQLPLRPGDSAPASVPEGLLGTKDGAFVYGGVAPGSEATTGELLYRLSQNHPRIKENKPNHAEAISETDEILSTNSDNLQVFAADVSDTVEKKPTEDANFFSNGVNMSQSKEESETRSSFAYSAENPIISRANSVFSRLEARRSDPNEASKSIPNSGHIVDNPVDNVDNKTVFSVQNRDISGNVSTDRPSLPREMQSDDAAYDVAKPLLCVQHEEASPIRLFPLIFPGAVWRAVNDGGRTRFEGLWQYHGERVRILAVRGAYAPEPPKGLSGYTRYLRQDGAGYWVRLLPMGRCPNL